MMKSKRFICLAFDDCKVVHFRPGNLFNLIRHKPQGASHEALSLAGTVHYEIHINSTCNKHVICAVNIPGRYS